MSQICGALGSHDIGVGDHLRSQQPSTDAYNCALLPVTVHLSITITGNINTI